MGGHEHSHETLHAGDQTRTRLLLSLFITAGFVVFEAMAGLNAHSLALLTDAAHNLTDVLALGLSWYAHHLSEKPAHARKTFGYHRVGILAALANSMTLAVISAGIGFEAWQRFQAPVPVDANVLMSVGGIALAVNLVTAWLVSHGSGHDLNLRSAFLHLLGDVLATIGAILAGVGIYYSGLYWLDPLASALIAGLILWNAWLIVRETVDILLESTPRDIEMSEMVRDLMQTEGVMGVHDLHVWSLSRQLRFLSVHILTNDMSLSQAGELRGRLAGLIGQHYGIHHTTFQFESSPACPDQLYCKLPRHCSPHPGDLTGSDRHGA